MSRSASRRDIGRRIREQREAKGLTGELLAKRARTDKGTISRIERGQMRIDTDRLQKIAEVLGIEPAALLGASAAAR